MEEKTSVILRITFPVKYVFPENEKTSQEKEEIEKFYANLFAEESE